MTPTATSDPNAQQQPLRHPWRTGFLILIGTYFTVQLFALSPSNLEQDVAPEAVNESSLRENTLTAPLASGIPKDRVPEYTIDGFNYVSIQSGVKQWKLLAKRAFFYNREHIVHAREVTAYLYDAKNEVTTVTAREAKYRMDKNDLEVFGQVQSVMPDGFRTYSEYLRYLTKKKQIEIPVTYAVSGQSDPDQKGQIMTFESYGMDYDMNVAVIALLQAVKVKSIKGTDWTTIESDRCEIDRNRQIAHFTMSDARRLSDRFVHIEQPTMKATGRSVDLSYGSKTASESGSRLDDLVAHDDVTIRESKPALDGQPAVSRYGTAGVAEFRAKDNTIVLKEYPQVYQDGDTVTGDVIKVYRDTDIVEVENSNAFSTGNNNPASR